MPGREVEDDRAHDVRGAAGGADRDDVDTLVPPVTGTSTLQVPAGADGRRRRRRPESASVFVAAT